MRPTSVVVALLLGALLGLSGCGQKGPLYHPDDEEAAKRYDPASQLEQDQQDEEETEQDTSDDGTQDSTTQDSTSSAGEN
ncbi:LPS translocon maturation chaperone LptM [Halomonas binhaiensis]|uniref:Lipoprotein n=1 Tax=Halomonas binhaiensis TaxID=2562282 RepID=A0A5C1NJP8_9GAMM|nr:lipoprotein [Halomonas binhaiensis]QEM83506.1 lipoprotein [Halomonas binhaiensis]